MNEITHKLTISVTVGETEKVVELNGDEFVFGRSSTSGVYMDDPALSRSHFKIFILKNILMIEDLNSSNGTFLNGVKLIPKNQNNLEISDKITINNTDSNIKIIAFEKISNQSSELSDQILEVANLNIEKILSNARVKADELIVEARQVAELELDNARKLNTLNSDKQRNDLDETLLLEKENKLKLLSQEIQKSKQVKVTELDSEISIKRKEMLSSLEAERIIHSDENENLKLKLRNDIDDVEAVLARKKIEIEELEKDFRKNSDQLNQEIDEKIALKRKDLDELDSNFNEKKSNQEKILLEEINLKKEKLVEDLNSTELLTKQNKVTLSNTVANLELKIEELGIITKELSAQRVIVSEVKNEIDQLRELQEKVKTNHELALKENENLAQSNISLMANCSDEKEKIESLKKNHENVLTELATFATNKNNLLEECELIEKSLKDLKAKSALISEEANSFIAKKENEKQILQSTFLAEKSKFEDEMRKLRESEELRLQELVRTELSQVNKIKEDSLKLILDLEESITKELSLATSKVFANTIGIDKFRQIAPEYELSIKSSLQTGVLKLLKNELTPDMANKSKRLSSNKKTAPFLAGLAISAIGFGVIPYSLKYIQEQNDPVRIQKERDELLAKTPIRKFQAIKTSKIGSNFVNSVIYTNDYVKLTSSEKFRSDLMKNGSLYLYKQWQIDEEKSIQSYSMIFSMIDSLNERVEKIDPDNEKRDIDKMLSYEKETLKKLEVILGNEVRLEAAVKFFNRYYLEYPVDQK